MSEYTATTHPHTLCPHSPPPASLGRRPSGPASLMQLLESYAAPPTPLQPARTYILTVHACMHPTPPSSPSRVPASRASGPVLASCADVQRCAAVQRGVTAHHTSHHLASSSIIQLASSTNQANQARQASLHPSGFIGGGGSQVPCREAGCRSRGLLGFGALCSSAVQCILCRCCVEYKN